MSFLIIPVDQLSVEALNGVIEEFISRDGTDYGETEVCSETKFRQVKQILERGLAVLVYDDKAETTSIIMKADPVLSKIDQSDE